MSQIELIVSNIASIEVISKFGMSLSFGICVLFYLFLLNFESSSTKIFTYLQHISRLIYRAGTSFILLSLITQYVYPTLSVTFILYLCFCYVISILTSFRSALDKEFLPIYFLSSAIIFLFVTLISYLDKRTLILNQITDVYLIWHIVLSIVSMTTIILSFFSSILYCVNYKKIKNVILIENVSLNLSTLDKIIYRLTFIGLTTMTIALVLGLIVSLTNQNIFQVGLMKIVWSFFVWFWFVVFIFGRGKYDWKGRKAAILNIFGMFFLFLGFIGSIFKYII